MRALILLSLTICLASCTKTVYVPQIEVQTVTEYVPISPDLLTPCLVPETPLETYRDALLRLADLRLAVEDCNSKLMFIRDLQP